jgi:parallel beta-helix repeat protein
MRFPAAASCAAFLLTAAATASADTLRVPSDDFPTIQSAVDAAGVGDTVLIGPGTYDEQVVVTDKAGLILKGRGWPRLAPDTGGVILEIEAGSQEILVTGIEFQGGGDSIRVENSSDVALVNLRVHESAQSGIFSIANDGILVSRCTISQTGGNGVTDFGSTGFVAEKCRFEDIDEYAFFLSDADVTPTVGAVVSKNRVDGATYGVLIGGADNVIEKNRFENLTDRGIWAGWFAGTRAVVTGNRVQTTGAFGIDGVGDDVEFVGNTLEGGALRFSTDSSLVDRNRVTGAISGIALRIAGDGNTVTRNQVRGGNVQGIMLAGNDFVADRNLVADVGNAGLYVQGNGSTVTRNRVTGSGGVGVLVEGSPNTFTGNRASGSGIFDLADSSAEGANTYEGNRFGTTAFNYSID